MYILRNAFISITRNKGRNILIGIIVFIIALTCTIALAINNTAKDLIKSYENSKSKELTITFNRENMVKDTDFSNRDSINNTKEKFDNIESYSVSDIDTFSKNKHIKSYYYTYELSLNGDNISKAEESSENNNFSRKFDNKNNDRLDFEVIGYSSLESMNEFIDGKYKIDKITDNAWDIAFNGNYVFINEELASYNNLSLNDKITLKDSNSNTYEFEIIGIFKENEDNSDSDINMFSTSVNKIITNSSALLNITNSNSELKGKITPTFIIDSYDSKDEIEEYFHNNGLDSTYTVRTNESEALSSLNSLNNVKSFALTFLIIIVIIGALILFIINMINLRERKYEIGVLRTIGMSKFKLALKFIVELMIVSFISLSMGAFIGGISSKSISNKLLSNEIKSSQNSANEIKENFGGPMNKDFKNIKGAKAIEAYDSINAVVDIKVIIELLVIGNLLVLVSSIFEVASIQRFSPLTILKERS